MKIKPVKGIYCLIILTILFLTTCGKDEMPESMKYTTGRLDTDPPCNYAVFSDNGNTDYNSVIYYFHGNGGNELSWQYVYADIIKYWNEEKKLFPVVVTITFGEKWILIPKNSSVKSGYLEYFVNSFIPYIENEYKLDIKERYILGQSMGGHSAAQLIFRYPETFSKAAIISPAIYPISIYSDDEEINKLIMEIRQKTARFRQSVKMYVFGIDVLKENVYTMFNGLKKYMPTDEDWAKTNIIENMKKPSSDGSPEIYISCGNNDEFGFFIGARDLYDKAVSQSYHAVWDLLEGGHNIRNNKAIAEFFN